MAKTHFCGKNMLGKWLFQWRTLMFQWFLKSQDIGLKENRRLQGFQQSPRSSMRGCFALPAVWGTIQTENWLLLKDNCPGRLFFFGGGLVGFHWIEGSAKCETAIHSRNVVIYHLRTSGAFWWPIWGLPKGRSFKGTSGCSSMLAFQRTLGCWNLVLRGHLEPDLQWGGVHPRPWKQQFPALPIGLV